MFKYSLYVLYLNYYKKEVYSLCSHPQIVSYLSSSNDRTEKKNYVNANNFNTVSSYKSEIAFMQSVCISFSY